MKPHKSGFNQKVRNHVAAAKQSGAGKHVDKRRKERLDASLRRLMRDVYPKMEGK